MGALINERAARSRDRLHRRGTARAPSSSAGGERPDRPGLLRRADDLRAHDNDIAIAQDEIFGPVGLVIPFDDPEDAIAIANDTRYGLAAYLWTRDLRRAPARRRLRAGSVWINGGGAAGRARAVGRRQDERDRSRARLRRHRGEHGREDRHDHALERGASTHHERHAWQTPERSTSAGSRSATRCWDRRRPREGRGAAAVHGRLRGARHALHVRRGRGDRAGPRPRATRSMITIAMLVGARPRARDPRAREGRADNGVTVDELRGAAAALRDLLRRPAAVDGFRKGDRRAAERGCFEREPMKARVGFVGLGNMGRPMARNLAAAGFPLTVRDANDRLQREDRRRARRRAGRDAADFADVRHRRHDAAGRRVVRRRLLGRGHRRRRCSRARSSST